MKVNNQNIKSSEIWYGIHMFLLSEMYLFSYRYKRKLYISLHSFLTQFNINKSKYV